MKHKLLLISTLLFLIFGYYYNVKAENHNSPSANIPAAVGDTSANALDWSGTYQGVLPCADCEGIKTTLTLNQDSSFMLQTQYLGKDDQVFEKQGKFVWNRAQNQITLQGIENAPNQFLVGENVLIQLNLEGDRITGDLADKYRLAKLEETMEEITGETLQGVRWELMEMMGKTVEKKEDQKAVFIMFNEGEKRVNGFSGCNNFMGGFEVKEGNRISFSQMASTMMACENLQDEVAFLQTLQKADNYTMKDGVLSLNRAKASPLLRFKAMNNQ